MAGEDGGYALGVDVGTSNTVAVVRWPDGRTRPLLFDGQPVMPSAVFLDDGGRLHVGRDAQRLARAQPARYEPNPKRRVDEPGVLLGDREVPTPDLLAAILGQVARTAVEAVGFLPPAAVTYPASWGARRRDVLASAITRAGWPSVGASGHGAGPVPEPRSAGGYGTRLVPEPVAAARYFAEVLRRPVPVGAALAVFDFGGGTLDVAVVRNEGPGFAVIGSGGVAELGGLDLDAALVDHLGRLLAPAHQQAWQALAQPATADQWRGRWQFWDDVRGAKEMLSRTAAAPVSVPGIDQAVHLTRDELERLATPLLRRAVFEAAAVIANCGLTPHQLAGLFLVGGSSRVPLVARLLHADLGIAPTVLEQPELPVAEGALAEIATAVPAPTAVQARTAVSVPAAAAPASVEPPTVPLSPAVAPVSPVPGMSISPAPVLAPPSAPVPPRRPRRLWLWAAAAVVALGGLVAAAFVVLTGDEYDPIDFQTPIAEVGRVSIGDEEPYYFYTDVVGDRAYLAFEREDKRLEIISVDPATAKERWRKQTSTISDRWYGITALPNAVVAYQDPATDSDLGDMLVLDPETGNQLWTRRVHDDDAVHYFKDVLVIVESEEERLIALDLRTGMTRWERPNPGKGSGSADSAVYTAQTVEDVTGPAGASGQPFAPRRDDDQRIVQIGADRSATVIDATSGKVLKERRNVADPDDDAMAYNGQLLVATQDDGYRIFAYDLDTMGEATSLYTAPDEQRRLDLVAMCGEKRACLLDSVNSDNKTTEVVAVDLEKGGQIWRSPAPDAEFLVHFDDYVVARNPSGDYRSRVFDGKGKELLNREGAVARVDAGNMLLFEEVSDIPEDYSVAGLNTGSTKPIELGQLKDVRSSTCSWNRTHIVCAGRADFLVARFAAG